MIIELLWVLAGVGVGAKAIIGRSIKRAEDSAEKSWIDNVTDRQLENKLWQDIHDPKKYEEIWERIESYKINGGRFSSEPGWEKVGSLRYRFFNNSGVPTKAYEGNREFAHARLVQTYDILPYRMAIFRSPQFLKARSKHDN